MHKVLHKSAFLHIFVAYIHLTKFFRCVIMKLWKRLFNRLDTSVRISEKNLAYLGKAAERRRLRRAWCFIHPMQTKKPFGKLKVFPIFGCCSISHSRANKVGHPPFVRRGLAETSGWACSQVDPPFA